jgi:hypothetical protein
LSASGSVLKSNGGISYELIGWENDDNKKHAAEVLATLHRSNYFHHIVSSVKSQNERRLQIILSSNHFIKPMFGENTEPVSWMVERKPGIFFFTILNRMLSYRSFLVIPFYTKEENEVTFRIWEKNTVMNEYHYSLNRSSFFGWVSIGLYFIDDHDQIDSMYERVTMKFISDLKKSL